MVWNLTANTRSASKNAKQNVSEEESIERREDEALVRKTEERTHQGDKWDEVVMDPKAAGSASRNPGRGRAASKDGRQLGCGGLGKLPQVARGNLTYESE